MRKKDCYIFDIDGTLADNRHRRDLIPDKKYWDLDHMWDDYNKACVDDEPVAAIVNILMAIQSNPLSEVIFVTARSERSYKETIGWLQRNIPNVEHRQLYMRRNGDNRPSREIKEEIFGEISNFMNIVAAFEDLPQIAEHLTEKGYNILLVNQHNGIRSV